MTRTDLAWGSWFFSSAVGPCVQNPSTLFIGIIAYSEWIHKVEKKHSIVIIKNFLPGAPYLDIAKMKTFDFHNSRVYFHLHEWVLLELYTSQPEGSWCNCPKTILFKEIQHTWCAWFNKITLLSLKKKRKERNSLSFKGELCKEHRLLIFMESFKINLRLLMRRNFIK